MKNEVIFNPDRRLYEYCRNATNIGEDTFVGFKNEIIDGEHKISINFPIGYNISNDEDNVREDILILLSILHKYINKDPFISNKNSVKDTYLVNFPLDSYLKVILNYLNYGYYYIREQEFGRGLSGAINWTRTIKFETPIPQKNGFIFMNYRVRKHNETDRYLITEIHKYCVYKSVLRLGWFFNLPSLPAPISKRDKKVYIQYLNEIILRTNKDEDKQLFSAMLDILNYESSYSNNENFYFGTYRFEYIWEDLVQKTYGNINKEKFFPKTKWRLIFAKEKVNTALEPDTIMVNDNSIFILDSKYYKYGVTLNPYDLPNSSSINKQITYGEHVSSNLEDFHEVYNAFLMPYNSINSPFNIDDQKYHSIGEGISTWKHSDDSYHRVQGILIDVKFLMSNLLTPNEKEISILSKKIMNSLEYNKNM